jgi:putative tricarboxylic transport membrane protein
LNGDQPRPLADIVFAAVVILFAGIVWWGTLDLPPPRYEPMGSAALPQALAAIMAVLALFVGARGVLAFAKASGTRPAPAPFRKRPALAVATLAILVAYLLLFEFRLTGFITASIPAFGLIGCMLVDFERKRVPYVLGFVVLIVTLSHFVFTRLFYIDLP